MEALQQEWIEAKEGGFNSGVDFKTWLCYQVIALREAAQHRAQADAATGVTSEGEHTSGAA